MSGKRSFVPSPAMAVACLALFMAMSGSVMAGVQIGKNSIGNKQLKKKAVKAANIADDTVTGKQVNESSLGVVPRAATAGTATAAQVATSATTATVATTAGSARTADRATSAASADRATDADRLGGKAAKDFAAATEVFPLALKLGANESRTLIERDGLRIFARCLTNQTVGSGGTADALEILAESTTDYATLDSPSTGQTLDGNGTAFLGPATAEAKRLLLRVYSSSSARTVRLRAAFTATSTNGVSVFIGSATVPGSSSGGSSTPATGNVRVTFGMYGALCSVSAPAMIATL